MNLSYDGKRDRYDIISSLLYYGREERERIIYYYFYDRWNGYNPEDHKAIVEEYSKVELAKRQLKAEKLQEELISGQLSEETVKKVLTMGVVFKLIHVNLL